VSSSIANIAAPADTGRQRRLSTTEIGLAIGFGLPFLVGLVDLIFDYFGWSWGPRIGMPWLCGELLILAALLALVHFRERLPLASVGLHRPVASDFTLGFAAYLFLMVLMVLTPPIYSLIRNGSPGDLAKGFEPLAPGIFTDLRALPLWLAIAIVVVAGMTTELAVRGYGIERLQALTGSVVAGAAAALVLDLLAHLPIWGFRYTLLFAPVQLCFIGLYLWRRRLMPCIVANVLLGLSGFLILSLQSVTLPTSDRVVRGSDLYLQGHYDDALKDFDAAIDADPNDAYAYLWRGSLYTNEGQYDRAIEDLSKAIRLDPRESEGYRLRGYDYLYQHDLAHAAADADAAIKFAPKGADAYDLRASIEAETGTSQRKSRTWTQRYGWPTTIAALSNIAAMRIRAMAITIAHCSTTPG